MGHPTADRMKARRVVVLVGLVLGMAVLTLQLARMADPRIVPMDDYVAYWAAGRLNAAGGNPYVPDSLLAPGEEIREYAGKVTPFWYPPWSLPLLMPFGMIDYPASRVL